MRVEFPCTPGLDVLTLTGALDCFTVSKLRNTVWSALCTQPVLLLDLDAVHFLDARGIATLIALRRWCMRRDAEVVLVCADAYVRKVLRICRLDTVARVIDAREASAISAISAIPRVPTG